MRRRRAYRPSSWIDPRVEVRPSPLHGKGLFAAASIRRGETVVIWGGVVLTQEEVDAGRYEPGTLGAIGEGLYMAGRPGDAKDPSDYMNHSCDPNVWMQDEVTLIARRDIAAGEELTLDYAMLEADEDCMAPWECRCGSALCRGGYSGQDWRSGELQSRYGDHFSPFINGRIRTLGPLESQ